MSIQEHLVSQFHRPRGMLGKLAGWIMSTRASNLDRNRWTVDLLDIQSSDRVLELGPGPGVTLSLLLDRAAHVTAVDHSRLMIETCRKRNRSAVDDDRLVLVQSSFTGLALEGLFDKIIAVNSLQFDAMNVETLTRLVELLAPGGKLAVTFQPRGENPTEAKAMAFAERVSGLLAEAGATPEAIEKLPTEPVCAVCVIATR